MAEYIDREVALKELNKNSITKKITLADGVSIFDTIKNIPTADEVTVVRCKKCKYFFDNCCNHPSNLVAYRVPDFGEHYVYKDGIKVKPDHFCGYGERKEGAEE